MFIRCALSLWAIMFSLIPFFASAESNNEVVSMRTVNSKTFLNNDGSFTSHVSMIPIHYKDASGNWNDISPNIMWPGVAKAATDSVFVNYPPPYQDAGRDDDGNYVFADDDGGSDDNHNIVGYCVDRTGIEPGRQYRQIFRWDVDFFYNGGTITISDMYYSINNINTQTQPDTLAVTKVASDPINWNAQSVWNNTTMWTPFKYVQITNTGVEKKIKIDLSGDISTLQDRANSETFKEYRNNGDLWYAVHHRMKTEGQTRGIDVCTAYIDSADATCGYLVITWSRSFPKIAVGNPHPVSVNPNPFNPTTTLSFTIDKPGNTKLEIFSINGQKVSTLVNNYLQTGLHSYIFNGSHLSSGIYFYRLNSPEGNIAGKFMLMK
jgi:hypothetical protein